MSVLFNQIFDNKEAWREDKEKNHFTKNIFSGKHYYVASSLLIQVFGYTFLKTCLATVWQKYQNLKTKNINNNREL